MDPDLSQLDEFLESEGYDGYLIDADGTDSDQRYLSGFDAPDPFVTLYDGEIALLVTGLEYGRAKKESRADEVARLSDFGYRSKLEEHGQPEAGNRVLAEFLEERGIDTVGTPKRFPLGTADGLRERGVDVTADPQDIVTDIRAVKTDEELDHIRTAQHANEQAMQVAEQLITESSVVDGELVLAGEPLTSERVRREIEMELLRHGCGLDETIVACGADAADPHDRGSGPLESNESIIIDIFPKDKDTGYHADMTRTFCKGEPSETLQEWFDLTDEARQAALAEVEAGVTGREVHEAVCDVYEDAGLPTLRSDESTETGFIHSTGHGVGLDVHEQPRIGQSGGELKPGHVITIEPGLYDPEVGGVRIEDFVVVTEDGYENLTDYPIELVVG